MDFVQFTADASKESGDPGLSSLVRSSGYSSSSSSKSKVSGDPGLSSSVKSSGGYSSSLGTELESLVDARGPDANKATHPQLLCQLVFSG